MRFVSSVAVTVAGVAGSDVGRVSHHHGPDGPCQFAGRKMNVSVTPTENECAYRICAARVSFANVQFDEFIDGVIVKEIARDLDESLVGAYRGDAGCPTDSRVLDKIHKGVERGTLVPSDTLMKWRLGLKEFLAAQGRKPSVCAISLGDRLNLQYAPDNECGYGICQARSLLTQIEPTPENKEMLATVIRQLDEALFNVVDGLGCGEKRARAVLHLLPMQLGHSSEVSASTLFGWQLAFQEILDGQGGESHKTLIEKFKSAHAHQTGPFSVFKRSVDSSAQVAYKIAKPLVGTLCAVDPEHRPDVCRVGFCKFLLQAATGAIEHSGSALGGSYLDLLQILNKATPVYKTGCPTHDDKNFFFNVNSQVLSLRDTESADLDLVKEALPK